MHDDRKKKRAREIASLLAKENYTSPIYKELGHLVLELIEEPEAPTIEETGWAEDYEGMIAIDWDGDEVILLDPLGAHCDNATYRVLWKNSQGRFTILEQRGKLLRPTGRYASADGVLKNREDQQ